LIETNDFRVGTAFEMDGKLLSIVTVEHIKLARAGAIIKAKLRNIRDGSIFEQSFRSGEKFKAVRIEKSEASYLYDEGDFYYFMDASTYEQTPLTRGQIEDVLPFLKAGSTVSLLRYEDSVIGVELPLTVDLEIAETEPGVRGDTVSGTTKPARVETGATVTVPLFVNQGDQIHVMEHAEPAGSVRVANEVIASIAGMAAREVDGVTALDEASARHFGDWIKRDTAHRGVRVLLDPERKIHLEVFLTVDATSVLRDVAERVQDNVIDVVHRMLALEVAEVNVFVSSIAFAR